MYQGFDNATPFTAEALFSADEEGRGLLVLVAKATFDVDRRGALVLAREQSPLRKAPVHHGKADASSLKYESEVAFAKGVTDVVLLGHARPERARAAEVDVSLRVGPLRKEVRVFGDRFWQKRLGGRAGISEPAPFDAMPLVYERSFGGTDRWSVGASDTNAFDPRNPVGVGFLVRAPDPASFGDGEIMLPNLEYPAQLIREMEDHPLPAGFGFIAPAWSPRRELAGTFDDAWKASRFPRLPKDFSRRHLNAAPADQQISVLRGGEPVEVLNASTRGPLRFELPRLALEASARVRGDEPRVVPMRIDTLLVDADAHRVEVTFRASFGIHRKTYDLEWSRVAVAQGEPHGAA